MRRKAGLKDQGPRKKRALMHGQREMQDSRGKPLGKVGDPAVENVIWSV